MTLITPESMMSEVNSVKSESPMESLPTAPRTAFIDKEPLKKDKARTPKTLPNTKTVDSSKPKKHKSRNGCITCKKKRLKCDETHPSCNNCSKKGIVCGGYNVAFKWKSFEDSSTGFKSNSVIKEKEKVASVSMDSSRSMPTKPETKTAPPRKMSRSLSNVDSDVLQRALEDATLSVTGKTYQEVAIANSLIASGKNPELAASIAKALNENMQTGDIQQVESLLQASLMQQEESSSSSTQSEKTSRKLTSSSGLDSLAMAALESETEGYHQHSPTGFSPFGSTIPEFFFHKHNNLPSPGTPNFPGVLMSPHLQDILHGFGSGEVSTPELLESLNQNTIKNKTDNHPSPGLGGFASPRFSTLMKSFTNFDPSLAAPSPANLDIPSTPDIGGSKKRRLSEISIHISNPHGSKRSYSERRAISPGTVLNQSVEDIGTSYEPLSPTNSTSSLQQLAIPPIPLQIELSDERMKMLAGFDRYTCGLMSIREGQDNPWRTVMIPMAKEHSVLFNVFSAMTCFHIARGDQELRSQGIKYMRNTVIELARGLSEGTMQPEVALVTCLCLQNSETWDRQISTGIAHLKGAKSMLIEILKNIQNGKKFLLDSNYEANEDHQIAPGSKLDKYGLVVDNHGKLVIQKKIPKNLLFLFNSFVYFDALARLTSESNDDIYGENANSIVPDSKNESAIISEDESDPENMPDPAEALRRMKSRTHSASPQSEYKHSASAATSFIELFNTINLEGHDIDPLLGCAHSLFPIIGKTAILASRVQKEKKNSLSIVSAAVSIKYELEQWKPPTVFNIRQGEDADLTSCISTAEAYRYATLIYLHQAVPEIPSKSSHELSGKVLMLLASIPNSSRTCITHIFPLLVASCEAHPGDERTWVLEKWDLLIRKMWIGNIDRSLEIVKECWIRRDIMAKRKSEKNDDMDNDCAEKLASRIAGYVATAQGEKRSQEEEDLSLSGIKSWCHWRTIMKEWGWEVFLG